jgi:hypothetical protein
MNQNRVLPWLRDVFANKPLFVRSFYADSLLEDFFVAAVAAVLAIRLYLAVTGYPQLTVGHIHIAHLVWGGLFMLVALVVLLSSLNQRSRVVAAVLGGVGFGAFIDELGKFVTSDNDYFFRPAVAIIYVVFVVIFLVIRTIGRDRALTQQQSLANAFEIAMQGSLSGLHTDQQEEALELLENSPPGQVKQGVESILRAVSVGRSTRLRIVEEGHRALDRVYATVASKAWFSGIVVAFFAFTAVTSLYALIGVVDWTLGVGLGVGVGVAILAVLASSFRSRVRNLNIALSVGIVLAALAIGWGVLGNLQKTPLSVAEYAQFVFPGATGIIIVAGMLTLPRSRLHAYLLFRLATLVSIFFTQVFAFYQQQFLALIGLLLDILILGALRYLIAHEHEKLKSRSAVVI